MSDNIEPNDLTPCFCGHLLDEHRDGGKECEVEGCDCCCFDADEGDE